MRVLLLALTLWVFADVAHARVSRIQITAQEDVMGGKSFGAAGPYEKLTARVFYVLDPKHPRNRGIVDLERAPRNANGEVEFSGDAVILRPKRGGGEVVIIDPVNRGQKFLAQDTPSEWWLRQGYTLVDLAWQFDVPADPARLHFDAPIARGLRGQVRSDFIVSENTAEHTLGHQITGLIGGTGYPVADRNSATLTERDAPIGQRRKIATTRWRFVDDRTIKLDGGFVPGRIYEVVYTAADPAVVGTGLAAVRDFASHCKTDPSSPARARFAYGIGISQTGRFLRHLVWQGFNADESNKLVFDALLLFVAGAGRGNFNHRFAQPSRDAQPVAPALYPIDLFPFTDEPTTDGGIKAGLLDRAKADRVVPKIFHVNTAYEYWSRGGSLIHTTPDGTRDIAPAPTSRIYAVAGFGHVAGKFPPTLDDRPAFRSQQLVNPNNITLIRLALVTALDSWTRFGVEPPDPKVADRTLVKPAQLAVKTIEGVSPPRFAYNPYRTTGNAEPPKVTGAYVALVPQIGADGNELGGVRVPELEIPLGAFTGWNARRPDSGFPEYRASFPGAFIPMSKTAIVSKYRDGDTYLGRFTAATLALVDQRFVLAEHVPIMLARARAFYDWAVR